MVDVIERYTGAWRLLVEYDERRLAETPAHPRKPTGTLGPVSQRHSSSPSSQGRRSLIRGEVPCNIQVAEMVQ